MDKIRVLIADRRELCREGLSMLLDDIDGIEVVAKCGVYEECMQIITQRKPDIVIIDPEGSCTDQVSANFDSEINRVKGLILKILSSKPQVGVILLTNSQSYSYIYQLLKAGASAYVSKDVSLRDLVAAINGVHEGQLIATPPLAAELVKHLVSSSDVVHSTVAKSFGLSSREIEILRLVREDKTNKDIAGTLCISVNTVKVHMRNIMEKLLVHSRRQALATLDNQANNTQVNNSQVNNGRLDNNHVRKF